MRHLKIWSNPFLVQMPKNIKILQILVTYVSNLKDK